MIIVKNSLMGLFLFLSFFVGPLFAQTYRDDSLIVVEILTVNGLDSIPVSEVSLTTEGRIDLLSLSGKGLRILPESVGKLDALEWLFIQDNGIQELPVSFSRLQNLKTVYLIRNRLTKWPDVFYRMPNLGTIDIGGNHLTEIPESISVCTTINKLYINDNFITKLPESITTLNLELIHVAGNGLCIVSSAVANWLNERDYYKENSQWRTYQDCAKASDSLIVRSLLDDNGMIRVPVDSVVVMQNGTIIGIDLSNERLAGFLSSGAVKRPVALYDGLTNMKYLRSLNLADNSMASLPQWFDLLCHLESLNLSNNHFTALPDFMAAFNNLKTLDLSGNRINAPSLQVLQWANTYAPGWRGKQIGTPVVSGQFGKQSDSPRIAITRSLNHSMGIQARFAKSLQAEIGVYSISGRQMIILAKKRFEPGVYNFNPDYSRLPGGTYLVTVKTGNSVVDAVKFIRY
jgi:hypothetical protein